MLMLPTNFEQVDPRYTWQNPSVSLLLRINNQDKIIIIIIFIVIPASEMGKKTVKDGVSLESNFVYGHSMTWGRNEGQNLKLENARARKRELPIKWNIAFCCPVDPWTQHSRPVDPALEGSAVRELFRKMMQNSQLDVRCYKNRLLRRKMYVM